MKRRQLLKGLAASTALVSIPSWCETARDYDVIVLGAGLSGLNSAYQLIQQGYRVLLLEGRERAGGRIQTLKQFDSNPELGGMQIGKTYGYMRTLAQEFGIGLMPLSGYVRQNSFAIDGQMISAQQWPTHSLNKLSEQEKKALAVIAVF